MTSGNKPNYQKLLVVGLLGIFAAALAISRADAASDTTQLTQQILNIVKNAIYGNQAIKNAVDALDTDNLDAAVSTRASQASVDALRSYAITVTASEPAADVTILPLEEGVMYKGHISGIMAINAIDDNKIALNCALHGDNAPLLTIASLDNFTGPATFQSVKLDATFTCTSLTIAAGAVTEQTSANLAIDYSVIEGIEEIEAVP